MPATSLDIDVVSALLEEVARDLIMPRFRSLTPDDVERKSTPTDPDDLVTVVDRATETRLTAALRELTPDAAVIGEEAAHENPALLDLLAGDRALWLIDPIDGTRNFVAGHDGFGIMLAYVTQGVSRAAWVYLPARSELFVAESGAGARVNGSSWRVPKPLPIGLRGALHTRYMPAAVRQAVVRTSAGRFDSQHDCRSAAVEYTEILRGRRDFAVYYRLLPWDHAAPGLILTEGGGWSGHLDGLPYSPRSADGVTVVARSHDIALQVGSWFNEVKD
jgi:fructose-1,6-bisphosphatase/inositol monophosphatase family enzyme